MNEDLRAVALAAARETSGGLIAKKLVKHEVFSYYKVSKGMPVARDNPGAQSAGQASRDALRNNNKGPIFNH
jgi:hypothetical protein